MPSAAPFFKKKALTVLFAICLSASTSFAQSSPQSKPKPDDATADATSGRPEAADQNEKDNGVEQDDPGVRLEWEKKAWGEANVEFSRHAAREGHKHNQKAGKKNKGADAGIALVGPSLDSSVNTSSLPATGPAWISIGPAGAVSEQNGSFTGLVRDSGRARTILPHPTDPDILYMLTSGGGLWKTTNFTSSNTTWTPLTDNLPTTGGGSVAFGRTPDVLYLGTGDPYDQILVGGAMVKSTDGGSSWSTMFELGNTVSVRAIAVDTSGPNDIVMVATEQGMYRSTDSGATYSAVGGVFAGKALWSIIRTSAGWLASAQPCSTLGEQCGFATVIYLSTDAGATWNPITNAGNVFALNGRTTLAVANPGEPTVYAYSSNTADTAFRDVYKSTDGGQTWVANTVVTKAPTNSVPGQTNMDICHGQCWYDQMILVDGGDPSRNTVYIGGNLATARTTNGGGSWTLTSWWLYSQTALPYVHADFHTAAYKSTGTPQLLFGSDGGLFVGRADGNTWSSDKNNGLVTHLFYTVAGQPQNPNFAIGGLQDNGTRIRVGNTSIFNQAIGGDGVGTNLSQANTNTSFGSAQGSAIRANVSGSLPDVYQNWVSGTSGLFTSEAGFLTDIFAPAANLDPGGKTFFTFTNTRVYKTVNGGLNWTVIARVNTAPTVGLPAGRTFRSTAYDLGVSPQDLNRIAVGAAGGFLDITTDGGANWVDLNLIAAVPGYQGFISNVTWADNQTIWIAAAAQATGSIRILKGTIASPGASWATATWTGSQNGLPDLPITKVLVDPRDASKNTLYAATHVGIYRTTDGGNNWVPYGTGLPTVRVSDMYMPPDGGYLRIATYGRGVWEIPQLEYVGAAIIDDGKSCDHDGALDNGETGHLVITLHNQGSNPLGNTVATVTSSNLHVTFPGGNSVSFPTAGGYGDTTAAIAVALNGASGIERSDFTISFTDPSLSVDSPLSAVSSQRLNYDEVANGSATETFEASTNVWTVSGTAPIFPNVQTWQRKEISPLQHVWNGPDNNGQTQGASNVVTDNSLTSPVMHVGTGPLSISFQHRFSFEVASTTSLPPSGFDAGVVEISTNGGGTWTDIGAGAYNGVIVAGDNPLGVRPAFVNRSVSYPAFVNATLNLGTAFANQDVMIRFRVGADSGVGAPGWDIDNISITGLTTTPFTAVVTHSGVCGTSVALSSSQNPSYFGQSVTFAADVSSGVSTATGNVAFKDGATTIGSSALDGSGQATFTTSSLSVGNHNLSAVYAGDPTHAGATSSVLVQSVGQAAQTITFAAIPNHQVGDAPFPISASASSGLPVSFVIVSGPATISGNTVTLTGPTGTVTVRASQAGDVNYIAAPDVNRSFEVGYSTCVLYDQNKVSKSGSTIPIKLKLCSSTGANLSSASTAVTAVNLVYVATSAGSVANDSGNANPDGNFRFDPTLAPGGGYIFNLSTKGLVAGTWQLVFTVSGDNTQHTVSFTIN